MSPTGMGPASRAGTATLKSQRRHEFRFRKDASACRGGADAADHAAARKTGRIDSPPPDYRISPPAQIVGWRFSRTVVTHAVGAGRGQYLPERSPLPGRYVQKNTQNIPVKKNNCFLGDMRVEWNQ
ncbi:hypothetical protein O4J55_06765 [Paracoccus sp. PXZ]